jgi:hypothetical protein
MHKYTSELRADELGIRTITFKKWDFSKKSKNSIFGLFLPILATFYKVKITFFKKLVDGAPATYLKFDVFWIYMLWGFALGYPKSVTKIFCTHFWVNKSLSMMCPISKVPRPCKVNTLAWDYMHWGYMHWGGGGGACFGQRLGFFLPKAIYRATRQLSARGRIHFWAP